MAVSSTQVSVGSTATVLVAAAVTLAAGSTYSETASAGLRTVFVQNGSTTIYLGGSTVTSSGATGGLPLTSGTVGPLYLRPTEALYGITASSTSTASVVITGT